MKDTHDGMTVDFATLEGSYAIPTEVFRFEDLSDSEKARILARMSAFKREKQYLAEALRRSAS